MISVEQFKLQDWDEIKEQKAQVFMRAYVFKEHLEPLETSNYAYSIRINGKLVVCGGVVEYWKGRGEAWAMIDGDCRNEFMAIHNVVKRFLHICPVKRIEATVESSFEQGHRWVRLLGFKKEAERLEAYMPDGKDATLYVRIK